MIVISHKPNLKAFKRFLLFASVSSLIFSCQPAENKDNVAENDTPVKTEATADTTNKRPAPDFYIIPPDLAQNRVWICDDAASDTFHTQNDCTVLVSCRQNNGTFRNVTLARAIEAYGRYNCEVCSPDLDHIFDKDMVR